LFGDEIRVTVINSLERDPMTRFQVTAILVCTVINMIDGFDVLVIAFTAPAISSEWNLSATQVGALLSAGLLGMAVGSLLLGPLADRYGRRVLILICLIVISAGMLLSGFSRGLEQLLVLRVLTGLGIGGMLPVLNTIVAEYSSLRWRSFWVSLLQGGYPIGATVGGMLIAILIASHGWRPAFFLGATASLVMIPLVWKQLPESLDFLLSRSSASTLDRINQLLSRLGKAPIAELPVAGGNTSPVKTGYADLVSSAGLLNRTVLLSLAFFMVMLTFYFVMSWTPKILVDSGMSAAQGISGGVLLNLGGIAGCVMLGYLSSHLRLPRLLAVYLILTGVLMVLFSGTGSHIALMVPVAASLGFFIFGSMVGLYALAPQLFPVNSRAAGISTAIGTGRIGAVLAPAVAGMLFDSGWAKMDGYVLFALPLVITFGAVVVLGRAVR
jgi:benzoate transport